MIYKNTPNDLIFRNDIIYSGKPYGKLFRNQLNNIGCIGDDFDHIKPENEKRIIILGGSNSYSTELVDIIKSVVKLNNPIYNIKVISASKPKYTSYNNYINFQNNLIQYSPDIIIIYPGNNDSIYNSFYWVDGLPDIGYFNYRSLYESIFVKLFKYHIIDKLIRSKSEFSSGKLRSTQILTSNISNIIEIAQSNNIRVILSTFAYSYPTNDSKLQKIILENEIPMQHFWGNLKSTVYCAEAHNEIVLKLAKNYNLDCIDMKNVIPNEIKYFRDICHLTSEGIFILGTQIGNKIGEIHNYSFAK